MTKQEKINWKWKFEQLSNMYADDQVTILKLLNKNKSTLHSWKYALEMWNYSMNIDMLTIAAFFIGGLILGLIIAT